MGCQFSVNLIPEAAKLAAAGCPNRATWELLSTRRWTIPVASAVPVIRTPRYQELAPSVAELASKRVSPQTIANALGVSRELVIDALNFARTGQIAISRPPGKSTGTGSGPPKYVQIAEDVARLRDIDQMPFTGIATALKVSCNTVTRAYDHSHQTELMESVERGGRPKRGRYSRIGIDAKKDIAQRLENKEPVAHIVAVVGCSPQTVYRVQQEQSLDSKGQGIDERAAKVKPASRTNAG